MPQPRVKARWDHEEKVLLARAELALVSEKGVVRTINKELAERVSGRTVEAIKKVRQRADYKEILASLKPPAHRTQDDQSEESVSPDLVIGTQDGRVEGDDSPEAQAHGTHDGGVDAGDSPETQASLGIAPSLPSQITPEQLPPLFEETGALGPQDTDSTEQCRWSDELRRALEGAQIDLGEMELDDINPGQPDDRVREALDDEYRRWLPPRERRRPALPRRAPQGASDRPRVKRRAQYARVQREYNRTDRAVRRMSSAVLGKIRQLSSLWQNKRGFGEVCLSVLLCLTIGVQILWGRQNGSLSPPLHQRRWLSLLKG